MWELIGGFWRLMFPPRSILVLVAADGRRNDEVAASLNCTRRTVGTLRNWFVVDRLAGIEHEAPRGGCIPFVRAAEETDVIANTARETPDNAKQCSVRTMA